MPSQSALYAIADIRAVEQTCLATLSEGTLMQRAGKAAAECALGLLPNASSRVLAVAGPGNNGGDVIEAARLLAEHGLDVTLWLCADRSSLPADAARMLENARSSPLNIVETPSALPDNMEGWNLVIDGLFGIGLTRPLKGLYGTLAEWINALSCPVLALDVPSGLDADTGAIVGEDGIAIRASHTITFIADKPGLHTLHGRDYAGHVHVASLDIDTNLFPPACAHLNSVSAFSAFLKKRPHNSHKGSFGDVIVAGGAPGMAGAPILAARAAAKCGAGRVYAAFIGDPPAYDSAQPELMCRAAPSMDFSTGAVVAGPGMGTSREAHDVLAAILHASSPLVLDADALNLIAAEPGLQARLAELTAPTVMTPHPLEAARLLQSSTADVQSDRLHSARALAQRFHAVVILKGSGSVIARPDGEAAINTTGNPALATAGTGDVLAGICGALLAQGFPAWQAALAATWLHGHAADTLVQQGIGPIGLTASELIPAVRTLLNQLTEAHAGNHIPH
ncbi:NAD(P)H-hydrate dehydratase [Noviherbaspirillum denitrificans]|uniref:Bifunctional NAD(P)H-hydrate repair enzyme n=1 Tax=Noviherbaspirillum denitrificans TaxID=1968433 RepID=A0A254TJP3_9BURK|nr:NAD(P)H-hydrate dehydratase [Noviherbaspirillum denitrificans]OWW22839.1 bifunctional ADP-dependent (S)-NAD(P)H-hydrate dehydratase/NAD(P)H-hydrate epimerase [Noviherbaspirillum denitrificans]